MFGFIAFGLYKNVIYFKHNNYLSGAQLGERNIMKKLFIINYCSVNIVITLISV